MSTIDAGNALIEEVTDNLDSKLKCSMVSFVKRPLIIIFELINLAILELEVYV